MSRRDLSQALMENLEAHGYRAKMMEAKRYYDAMEPAETYLNRSEIDPGLYHRYLSRLEAGPQEVMPGARSLLLVSLFQPQTRLNFSYAGRTWPVVVPPTYRWDEDRKLEDCIDEVLKPAGFRATRAKALRKRLAVCGGMARYGRNNLAYVEGWGSFHRLIAFYTDLDGGEDAWREPEMMDRCRDCSICRKACPTGAIREDRFLIQADLCLTYHNESDRPFGDWIDPAWHNSLVGCMRCQQVCPENTAFLKKLDEGCSFSEEETALILKTASLGDLPQDIHHRLERMGVALKSNILPRNLGALMGISGRNPVTLQNAE